MNGLNVKKLVALGIGAALVGAAVAPLASAQALDRSALFNESGDPIVDVVVGAGSQPSDGVWAANIAAKLAQLAYVEVAGTTDATGTYTGTISTGGGEESISSTGSYVIDTNTMSSTSGAKEFGRVTYTRSQLPWLVDKAYTQLLNSTNYSVTIKEEIHVNCDLLFDYTRTTVADLVGTCPGVGDFNYTVAASSGQPLVVLDAATGTTTDFSDGSDDYIVVPFFGQEYTVFSVTTSGTKPSETISSIKLAKSANERTLVAGEELEVAGVNNYAGQTLKLKLDGVSQTSSGGTYSGSFVVTDEEGNQVVSLNTGDGIFLAQSLRDASGQLVTSTENYISRISLDVSRDPAVGSVVLLTGSDILDLRADQYPFNSSDSDTSNDRWKVAFGPHVNSSSPDVNAISTISVYNNNISVSLRDSTNPLYSKNSSLTGKGTESEWNFLAGEPVGTNGKDFVIMRFDGWKTDNIRFSTLTIGGSVSGSSSGSSTGVVYKDSTGFEHKVPFYYTLSTSSQGGSTFTLDGATFYYRVSTSDLNFTLAGGDTNIINGYNPIKTLLDANLPLNTDQGDLNFSSLSVGVVSGVALGATRNIDLNGVNYYCTRTSATGHALNCAADGNLMVSTNGKSFSPEPVAGDVIGGTNQNRTWYYDDGNLAGKTTRAINQLAITSTTGMNSKTYNYVPYVNETQGRMYLLLGAGGVGGQAITDTENTNSFDFTFYGTDTGEDLIEDRYFYWPDFQELPNFEGSSTILGQTTTKSTSSPTGDSSDTAYFTAVFDVDTNKDAAYNAEVYVDTSTGKLVTLPNANLSIVSADVNFHNGQPSGNLWSLSDRTDVVVLHAGYDDYGTKISVADKVATFMVPHEAVKTKTTFYGSSTTVTVSEPVVVTYTCNPGDTEVVVEVGGSNQTVICPGAAAAGTTTRVYSTVEASVVLDSDAFNSAGPHIIVGGHLVNTLAESVVLADGRTSAEALTQSGDKVMEVLSNGNVYVAGWTAADTQSAARDLISALDNLTE
ncbi:MAG: S-layer protein [Candidatus Diapherotrites archaeon]|nr:S-layer protein [Candidatus Diapherotrites archaeon]